jgi:cell wall-associated NlpC family hydrolase
MTTHDCRLTPARPDLAAAHLEGIVAAPRYVTGTRMVIREASAPLRRHPVPDVSYDTEALYGEVMTVYDADEEGWSWGQLEADGYVGFLPSVALEPERGAASHRVDSIRTFLYPGPSIKLPPLLATGFGSRLRIIGEQGPFSLTDTNLYVWSSHLVPLEQPEPDFVGTAARFLGVPYLWGGRSSLGLDCSGLVQMALNAAGLACPRDSDQQAEALGVDIPVSGPLQRGDLIFWRGHVGLMSGPQTLLHANGHHMMVVEEPLAEACARISAAGSGPILRAKRL